MLTPLVDVMFLLLIFFMLSSQTSLYTLLQVSAEAAGGAEGQPSVSGQSGDLIAVVEHGEVRLNGRVLAFAHLPTELLRYRSAGIDRAVLISGSGAQVQDVVTALELFEAGEFTQVRLVASGQ